MLVDALVEVVEHTARLGDQPRRLRLIRRHLQLAESRPHILQRFLDGGESIEVDAAVDDA